MTTSFDLQLNWEHSPLHYQCTVADSYYLRYAALSRNNWDLTDDKSPPTFENTFPLYSIIQLCLTAIHHLAKVNELSKICMNSGYSCKHEAYLLLQLFFEFFDNYSVFSYAKLKVLTTEIHPWPTCYRDNLSLIIQKESKEEHF